MEFLKESVLLVLLVVLSTPETKAGILHYEMCEHYSARITCPEGFTLYVNSALYGRSEVHHKVCGSGANAKCGNAKTSKDKVFTACFGKRECTVSASNTFFGDPCVGTYKYLTLNMHCSKPSPPPAFAPKPVKWMKPIDLIFITDISKGVSKADQQISKDFFVYLLDQFKIGPQNTQVTLIYIGDQPYDMFCFNEHENRKELDESLEYSKCEGCKVEKRATAAALMNAANKQLDKKECGWRGKKSQTVVVLLVGGPASDPENLKAAGEAIRPKAKLVIVGIGPEKAKMKPQMDILIGWEYEFYVVYYLESWSTITLYKPTISGAVQKLKCNKKIDLLLIVDRSGSITTFGDIKEYLRKMMKEFQIGKKKTMVSVVIYAMKAYSILYFDGSSDEKKVAYTNAETLDKALADIKCPGRCKDWSTKTSRAFKMGYEKMLTAEHGMRKDAKQIILHFSDGESKESPQTVYDAADILRKKGPIIAVGVGKFTEDTDVHKRAKKEMEYIATKVKGVPMLYEVESFKVLKGVERVMASQICKTG